MKFITGYKGVNKQGLEYVVLDGRIAKKTKIRFIIDGEELVTTRHYLRNGLPMHPTHGKIKNGDTFCDRNGDPFELVEKVSGSSWKIRWVKDGAETVRETQAIKAGSVTHPLDGKVEDGQIWDSKHGRIIVLKYHNALEIDIQFEDGVRSKTTAQALRNNSVGHPMSGLHIGQKVKTNSGWNGTIVNYNSCYDIEVLWQDGSIQSCEASDIKSGSIKPLYQPSVAGVGYYGEGRFSNGLKSNGETPPAEIYNYWVRMINRCYNPEEIIKNTGRRYIFVNVCKEWFCFQNFAEWAISQPNWNLGHDLDKDLLGNGTEYSPSNCTFLPQDVNVFLAENWSKDIHNLPIGVQYIKPATAGAKEGYVARCHTDKGREYLGYFNDPMTAYFAYKNKKEEYAKVLAEKFKNVITEKAFNKLKEFKLNTVYSVKPHICGT